MMTQQPLEADFFPGILEGLVGRLGQVPPGAANPPTSIREGVIRCWVAALREAVKQTRGAMDPGQDSTGRTPHGLHLNYDVDFWSRRVDDIAPTLQSPLLPKLVGNILPPEQAPSPVEPPDFQPEWVPTPRSLHPSNQRGTRRALVILSWSPASCSRSSFHLARGQRKHRSLLLRSLLVRRMLLQRLTKRRHRWSPFLMTTDQARRSQAPLPQRVHGSQTVNGT